MAAPKVLPVLSMRERSQVVHDMLKDRLDTLVDAALAEDRLDMWLILCQEDHPDPVHAQLVPLDCWTPILQMIVFVRTPDGVRRCNISGTDTKDLYERPYSGQELERQYEALNKLLVEHNPKRIGINTGSSQWCAGGLTVVLKQALLQHIPEKYHDRLVPAENTCAFFMQTLTARELDVYAQVVALGRQVIAHVYSDACIIPGETRITDLRWIYWDHCKSLGVDLAFLPYFRRIRARQVEAQFGPEDAVLRPGDAIHCDVGIQYLRYLSDHQEWAYICRSGEAEAPESLQRIMAQTNRLQDVFMAEMTAGGGKTGNALLARMLGRAEAEGITGARIYSHSIGRLLHEPGPLIGLPWEQQDTGPRGEVALRPDTCFSMELCSAGPVPEWGLESVSLSMEQDVMVDAEGRCRLLSGRQTVFHYIR